jgi:hypothetical protein
VTEVTENPRSAEINVSSNDRLVSAEREISVKIERFHPIDR